MEQKNVKKYLFGILTSQMGTHLFLISMSVWLMETYGETQKIGLLLFCSSIASVIVSPFVGVWIDRISPKRTMVIADLFSSFFMFIIAYLMSDFAQFNIRLELIYLFTFLTSVMVALFTPSSLTLVNLIVSKDKVREVNGKASNLTEVSRMLGRALAGALLIYLSPIILVLINAFSFLISAVIESKIKLNKTYESSNKSSKGYFSDLKDGFKYLLSNKTLLMLFIGAAITNFFIAINGTLMPLFIKSVLKFDMWWYGIILSAIGLGSLIGGYLARKISKEHCKKLFYYGLIFQGVPFVFIPLSNHPGFVYLLMFLVGLCYVFVQVNMLSIVSSLVSKEFLGRVFSLMFMIVSLFVPLSYLLTGFLGDLLNEKVFSIYYIAGFSMVIVWSVVIKMLKARQDLDRVMS